MVTKYLIRLFIPLFLMIYSAGAQNTVFKKADSLFAAARYEDAISAYKEIQIRSVKEKKAEQEILADLGTIRSLYWLGRFDDAQNVIRSTSEKVEFKKLTRHIVAVKLFVQNGLVLQSLGKNDEAEKEFNKALGLLNSSVKSDQEEANLYNYLGVLNWNKGNNELALEHLNRSLSIRQRLYSNDNEEIAACYNDLGLVYASMGKTEEAYKNYKEAQKIYEKVYGTNHPKTGLACNNLGIIAQKKGDYQEALSQFQNAITIYKGLYGDQHPNVAFVYATIAQLHQEREEYDEALDFFEKALVIYQKVYGTRHPEIAVVYNQRALIYNAQREFKKSLSSVQEALCANSPDFSNKDIHVNPPVSSYYKSNLLLSSLLIKAQVLETEYSTKTLKKENLEIALATLRSCDTLIAKTRQLKTNKADKLELSSSSAQVYEEAIRICFILSDISLNKKIYHEQAFGFAEKGKSAILQEAISDVEAKHFANIPDSLLVKEKELKNSITLYEQKLAERKEPEKEALYKEQLFSTNRQYEQFIQKLEQQFPEYYELKYDVRAVTIKEIQSSLKPGEALLSYCMSDSTHRLYVFYFDQKKFKAFDLSLSPVLFRNMKGLRNAIKFDDKEFFAQVSNDLYEALFDFRIPAYVKSIIMIPEGRLGTLPYEALLMRKPKKNYEYKDAPFLITRYSMSIQYSATLYVSTQKKKASTAKGIFLCAPVDFSKSGISNLPGSKAEVETIGNVIKYAICIQKAKRMRPISNPVNSEPADWYILQRMEL
jgi:tetratricopeptide (TPR) repeat protein